MRTDSWQTPPWLFALLDEEFRFDLDAAASTDTALCSRFLDNALGPEPWPGIRVFMNPPYSRSVLVPLLERAVDESSSRVVVVVLPVRADTDWWHDLVIAHASEIRFVRRRVAFVPPKGHDYGRSNRPGHATAIAVFRPLPSATSPEVRSVQGRPVRKCDYLPQLGQLSWAERRV